VGRAHIDDAGRFCAQGDEYYSNCAADIFADTAPPLVVGQQKQRAVTSLDKSTWKWEQR
jgi:hypothetical protein